jgi:hypothetical protein
MGYASPALTIGGTKMQTITISFDDFVDFMFEALMDFGYVPTEAEVEMVVSLALDYLFSILEDQFDCEEVD